MAFTVETGSVVAGANAYVTVEEFKSYHSDRANAYTATDPAIQAAIIKATTYLDGKYRLRWKGVAVSSLQALSWPRYGVTTESGYTLASNAIPQAVKDATCEAALRSLSAPLAKDLAPGVKRKKTDVLETEYATSSAEPVKYQIIDQLLSALLKCSNELVRG